MYKARLGLHGRSGREVAVKTLKGLKIITLVESTREVYSFVVGSLQEILTK